MEKNPRNAAARNMSVDLLKIISMLMVVALHITSHGIKNAEIVLFRAPYWFTVILNSFSLVAVNCFVLISGYYLSKGKVTYQRIIPLWIQVFAYSVGLYLVLCLIFPADVPFSIRGLLEHCVPLLTNQYWFFKYYVLLLLIAPFLNQLIAALEQKQYERMLLMCMVLFSIIPSVNIFGDTFGAGAGYSLVWFTVLYLLAGYLRKYPMSKRHWLLMYLCCSAGTILMRICGGALGGVINGMANLQRNYNSPFVVAASVCLFLAALGGPTTYGARADAVIKKISGLSFAVYLLHDHGTVSPLLWNEWVDLGQYTHSATAFIGRAVGVWVLIFVCGILTELILNTACNIFTKKILGAITKRLRRSNETT